LQRVRHFILGSPAQLGLIALMLLGCLFIFVGAPVLWLWIGSQVQASASVGTALMVAMLGAIATILLVAPALAWLNRKHVELREARDQPIGRTSALEAMLVVSAAIAIVGFSIWFFGFSGSSPVPLNIGY
jgi:heme/copper-type cytochrome/quinol oxidase subunit 2